ncbi:uncharacterized protein LOC132751072 [Ruditapes philippinarum]|uniref:uncharacterized protein LOC132751072 n=1 Tax=Ruditapes philippinarum TaxID=129788 RepID=UPI00295A95BC|nr:uncharacterized protein LOC132751072 [Ruditapes philippinarum]
MASGGSEHSSDEIFNFKCSPCLDDKRNREATKYCVECQGYYCQTCADMFHKMPGLKSHTFLDQTNYKSSSGIGGLPAIPTQRCSVHKTKIVDMYCGNHDEVGCTTCMALDHRSCSGVKSIPDIVDKAHSTQDIKTLNKKLKDLKQLKEKFIVAKRAQREELKKSKFNALREIKNYRQELDAILDNIEENSIAEIEKIFQEVDSELLQDNTITEDEIARLEQSLNDLKQSEGNMAQQFVSMKISSSYISKMNDATFPEKSNFETKITINVDPKIKSTLQNLKTFGPAVRPSTKPKVWAVECIKDLDIHLQSEVQPLVYGTCITTDGFLLIADYRNNRLKRADIQNMIIKDHCSLPGSPYGVCCTSDSEAAVSLGDRSVQFVSLHSQLLLTRKTKFNHLCFGIACNEQKLYLTDLGSSLYIYDLTGTLMHVVSRDNNGRIIFSGSRHIAFSDVDDKMFVASWEDGLISLDGKGNYCQTLTDPELNKVSSVCNDGSGTLFVSGYSPNNEIQFGRDMKKMFEVIKQSDGIRNIQSVCFDKRKRALVIAGDSCNVVKVAFLK